MEPTTSHSVKTKCTYCDAECDPRTIVHQNENSFCCFGCATIYDVLENNAHFDVDDSEISIEYKQYDLEEVFNRLVDFQNDKIYKIVLNAPAIHCSSCVQLLEDLPEINSQVVNTRVNFEDRSITVVASKELPLSKLAMLLDKLGYPPQFNLTRKADQEQKDKQVKLLRKVAVAGFCFGNSMMFSMPHYLGLQISGDPFFVGLFRYLNVGLSALVLAYPARDYFTTAYQAIIRKKSHIDIPIVMGVLAIWIWSLYEIFSGAGFGYLDSLAGLIFFLLIGKWYQNKVYRKISFERSIHDFLPISVRVKAGDDNGWGKVDDLVPGDTVVVKQGEVIPVNGTLGEGDARIDYSFVTGEAIPERVEVGEPVFVGGRQTSGTIELTITEKQDTTRIWSAWKTPKTESEDKTHWTTKVSMYFTPAVIVVAVASLIAWLFIDPSKAVFVFSAVLIVACPCALALSGPFTFGSIVRVLSKNKLYLKSSENVERLGNINHIVFDKTGTLTNSQSMNVAASDTGLTLAHRSMIKSLVEQSNHPLSEALSVYLADVPQTSLHDFEAYEGLGLKAISKTGSSIKVGSAEFVGVEPTSETRVYVEIDGTVLGHYTFSTAYKSGIQQTLQQLGKWFKISVISGDNDGERNTLSSLYTNFRNLLFGQRPEDKKEFIQTCHQQGDKTLMIGDGLNDQTALHRSDIGLAVADNINGFYPSADGILLSESFDKLPAMLALSKYSERVLKASLAFSVFYNLIGITFAVAGSLTPIVAAILMPLSSITVVGLVTALVSFQARKLQLI